MYLNSSKKPKERVLINGKASQGGGATAAVTTHCQVLPDGKVLRLDIAQVQPVCEVVLKVPHQIQEAQCNVIGRLPGVGPALGGCHSIL